VDFWLEAPTILIPREVCASIHKSLGCCPHTHSRCDGKGKNNPLERINLEWPNCKQIFPKSVVDFFWRCFSTCLALEVLPGVLVPGSITLRVITGHANLLATINSKALMISVLGKEVG
jgi:hypothetical protein